ncbi:DUF1214 domain-containing protein [Mycolicibacterium chlorophenolicum]|uniref:DUF1214 domain-containing protein n=1 Tax=Mycolicibacterium chlorophenolicum TaxID=37916 RepID=A0A0J6Z116_9MYCO|nr:DUF1214 domain-containing protein [Mycolicibacterium chlorophenolicum]KMO78361.1 hypothetical protein MCHLDSM_02278 [Mycolicibacterium chlorophenolicum]
MSSMPRDPVRLLARALDHASDVVARETEGLGDREVERGLFFLTSAYDLATEMWLQKGDPAAPELTNWEYPWRKYGGDNPTTSYLSAPVSPGRRYRLRGAVGDAVYAGVQVYTRGPGFNAPSANISDPLGADGEIDLLIGGEQPADDSPWLPLTTGDYLIMVRLYHRRPPATVPQLSFTRVDEAAQPELSWAQRALAAEAFFRDAVQSALSVTEVLRAAGVNAYPPPDATVHQPRYTGALFPTVDNVYDGFFVSLGPGQALRLQGRAPSARFFSFVFYDRWFNTPDFRSHRCFLTDSDIALEGGSYEVVLGPDDPGHVNWIDTAGLTEGIFAIRCLLPRERHLPTATVVGRGVSR